MTFGLLWSVTVVGAVVFAAPYLLRPSSDGPAEVGDRFAVSAALGAVVGILAAEVLSARGGLQMPSRTATDVGFWVAVCAGATIYAGRAKRRAFVTASARVADVVPWVLLAYGAYLALCWLRASCASIGGTPAAGAGAETVAGIVLMVGAVTLHRAWPLGEHRRVAVAIVAVATVRIVLASLHVPVGDRPASTLAAAMVGLTAGFLALARLSRTRRYCVSSRSPTG